MRVAWADGTRWIVERTLAWIDRFRRKSQGLRTQSPKTSEYLIQIAMTRLMLKRLARSNE